MEISEIKQKLSILEVIRHYGLAPDKKNMVVCPFHDDKTPSMKIYPSTGSFNCFGCGKGGDQIKFIELKENSGKHQAILKAKELLHAATGPTKGMEHSNKNKKNGEQTKIAAAMPDQEEQQAMPDIPPQQRIYALTTAFTYFARSVKSMQSARDYLQSRALNYKQINVGYDNHNFHQAPALRKHGDKAEKLKQLYLQLGLIIPEKLNRSKNNFHSRFDKCVIFPMLDKQGNIVDLYGRHTEKHGHYYLPGHHHGLYPKYPEENTKKLILTESIIDAATLLHTAQIKEHYGILALYGTNGFTQEHAQAIKELKELEEIIYFFDGDNSGLEGIQKHTEKLKATHPHLTLSMAAMPPDEDINHLWQSYESGEYFSELLQNRQVIHHGNNKEFFLLKQKNTKNTISTAKPPATAGSVASQDKDNLCSLDASNPEYLGFQTEHLQIKLWGGIDLYNTKRLRATLHISARDNAYNNIRDTIDLYSYNHVERFTRQCSERLEQSTQDITNALSLLTASLEAYRSTKREQKRQAEQQRQEQEYDKFTPDALQKAGDFLKDKALHQKTMQLFNHIGLIGQEKNGCLLFFIYLTRLLDNPLHAIVMGSSGSGKTYLLKTVAGLVPRQHIRCVTSLSENTLYYTPKEFLKNKILLQEDLDGAYNALLPLRELMSNQEISRFSTKTNSRTGESQQIYLEVKGPVCIAGATTKEKIYEDNANRSFLIQLEESPYYEQQALNYQGMIEAGQVDTKKQQQVGELLKACQLLLSPVKVLNPYAPQLQLPPSIFKKMRTNKHYLTLIKSIALWNQKQRTWKTDKEGLLTGEPGAKYIQVALSDIALANELSKDLLLRKSDELSGELRQFFEGLKRHVRQKEDSNKGFFIRDIRGRMHPMKLKRWIDELQSRAYIRKIGGNNKTGFEYEILVWDDYKQLKNGINILDKVLEELKNKHQ